MQGADEALKLVANYLEHSVAHSTIQTAEI